VEGGRSVSEFEKSMMFLWYRCGYQNDLLFDETNSANLNYLAFTPIGTYLKVVDTADEKFR